jgi:hypothetical protein
VRSFLFVCFAVAIYECALERLQDLVDSGCPIRVYVTHFCGYFKFVASVYSNLKAAFAYTRHYHRGSL